MSSIRKTHLNHIVGVIFRGSLWLDGVFTCTASTKENYVPGLASAIRGSKQYSQLHAAIFSRENILPNGVQDYDRLADEINLPILVLKNQGKCKQSSTSIWSPNENPERVNELFAIACAEKESVPEAVRVADLIAKQL